MKNYATTVVEAGIALTVCDLFIFVLKQVPKGGIDPVAMGNRIKLLDVVEDVEIGAEIDFSPEQLIAMRDVWRASTAPAVDRGINKLRDELEAAAVAKTSSSKKGPKAQSA